MQRAGASFGAGAQWFADVPALTAALAAALQAGGSEVRVLVKGSRFNRLERLVDVLTGSAAANTDGH
jgi:UDP-N-acetylmuramyl pentapeptide synthase